MSPQSQAGTRPEQVFVDPIDHWYPTLLCYDLVHVKDIWTVSTVEPVRPEDKLMMGLLKTPDKTAGRAMQQATTDMGGLFAGLVRHFPQRAPVLAEPAFCVIAARR